MLESSKLGDKNLDKAIKQTSDDIFSIYKCVNSSLPVVQERTVLRRINTLYGQYRQQKKAGYTGKKKTDFLQTLSAVFDIVKCKCKILKCADSSCPEDCKLKAHIECKCPKEDKIPPDELFYIFSERKREGKRSDFVLGGHDKVIEEKITKQIEAKERSNLRKEREAEVLESQRAQLNFNPPSNTVQCEDQEPMELDQDSRDEDYGGLPSPKVRLKVKRKKLKPAKFNTTKLNNTAKEAVRWGVPPRAAAAIANAVLTDYKVYTYK